VPTSTIRTPRSSGPHNSTSLRSGLGQVRPVIFRCGYGSYEAWHMGGTTSPTYNPLIALRKSLSAAAVILTASYVEWLVGLG
jgi:hypothetical protein